MDWSDLLDSVLPVWLASRKTLALDGIIIIIVEVTNCVTLILGYRVLVPLQEGARRLRLMLSEY